MASALDISTSALVAQRTQLDLISANIANISTVVNEDGKYEPYQPRYAVLQTDNDVSTTSGASGVKVATVETDKREPNYRYEPDSPYAIKTGKWKDYVAYPNINMTTEMVDALQATRAYEANLGVMEISKSLGRETLRILV
jgi:flagellar basal-body rod protein FlgC